MDSLTLLKFQGLHSVPDASLWEELGKRKLESYKLNDNSVELIGWYNTSRSVHVGSRVTLRATSFDVDNVGLVGEGFPVRGMLINTNTIDEFKKINKMEVLNKVGNEILADIKSGRVTEDPSLLVRFVLLSFADLKKHKYVYWFGFPAIVDPAVSFQTPEEKDQSMEPLLSMFSIEQHKCLEDFVSNPKYPFFLCIMKTGEESHIRPLSEWENLTGIEKECTYFGFVDPCPLEGNPGWVLRNFLIYIRTLRKKERESIVCLRHSITGSKVLLVNTTMVDNISDTAKKNTFVGWEPNSNGKMGPRVIDLSAHLDPVRLAEAACNLNLKLMTWRALPELNLDLLAKTKCLLLGSGTLGCAVARGLLGWGFRNITMVDNGKVSYSNPVRQSLFTFENCKNGGKPKAEAAVDSLKAIFPGVNAQHVHLNIPMPGHFVTSDAEQQQVQLAVEKLEELIQQHDVVFLLTDTRESRWLPTVFCAMYDKILINAALGFDGYLVMRHGHGVYATEDLKAEDETHKRLGCYFCNDVVAPRNSTQDRTLDQQCTVTRPGLAPVAGALAVEMLVNLLHNELGSRAPCSPASTPKNSNVPNPKLGILPHQIRGFFATFSSVLVEGPVFNQCTACSSRIVNKIKEEGFPTLLRIFNDPDYLESLAGLDELKTDMELCDFDEDWAED